MKYDVNFNDFAERIALILRRGHCDIPVSCQQEICKMISLAERQQDQMMGRAEVNHYHKESLNMLSKVLKEIMETLYKMEDRTIPERKVYGEETLTLTVRKGAEIGIRIDTNSMIPSSEIIIKSEEKEK